MQKYNVGDLVILEPHMWTHCFGGKEKLLVGVITQIYDDQKNQYIAYFEGVPKGLKERLIWTDYVMQHYPVKQ